MAPLGKSHWNFQHGSYGTPEYKAWDSAKQRCYNPSHPSFENYGGRGIAMCDRWFCNFSAFYQDMGPRPSSKYTIGRIDNNGNYEPNNCEWQTKSKQARNRRTGKLTLPKILEIRGLYSLGITQVQLAERYGVCQPHISDVVNCKEWKES